MFYLAIIDAKLAKSAGAQIICAADKFTATLPSADAEDEEQQTDAAEGVPTREEIAEMELPAVRKFIREYCGTVKRADEEITRAGACSLSAILLNDNTKGSTTTSGVQYLAACLGVEEVKPLSKLTSAVLEALKGKMDDSDEEEEEETEEAEEETEDEEDEEEEGDEETEEIATPMDEYLTEDHLSVAGDFLSSAVAESKSFYKKKMIPQLQSWAESLLAAAKDANVKSEKAYVKLLKSMAAFAVDEEIDVVVRATAVIAMFVDDASGEIAEMGVAYTHGEDAFVNGAPALPVEEPDTDLVGEDFDGLAYYSPLTPSCMYGYTDDEYVVFGGDESDEEEEEEETEEETEEVEEEETEEEEEEIEDDEEEEEEEEEEAPKKSAKKAASKKAAAPPAKKSAKKAKKSRF